MKSFSFAIPALILFTALCSGPAAHAANIDFTTMSAGSGSGSGTSSPGGSASPNGGPIVIVDPGGSACTNSPECPTAVLGLLGVGGMFAARRLRRKLIPGPPAPLMQNQN